MTILVEATGSCDLKEVESHTPSSNDQALLACSFLFVKTVSHPIFLAGLKLVTILLLLSILSCWDISHDSYFNMALELQNSHHH